MYDRITTLRNSSTHKLSIEHKLAIECGRYINIPKYERFCIVCDSAVNEDEEHFTQIRLV